MQVLTPDVRWDRAKLPHRTTARRLLLAAATVLTGALVLAIAFVLAGSPGLVAAQSQTVASTADLGVAGPADHLASGSGPESVRSVTIGLTKVAAPDPDGYRLVGDTVVFTITITNEDLFVPIEFLPLRDEFSPTHLSYVSASPPPQTVTAGVLLWEDLIANPRGGVLLDPGDSMSVIVTFTAQASGVTTNTASITGAYFQGLPTPVDAGPAPAAVTFYDQDFGDAPDPTYPTLLASNGARHMIIPGFFLGMLIDGELDGQPNPTATGDDLANLPDEDGVTFNTGIIPGQVALVMVVASAPGFLDAWLDFNADGDWADPGEQIFLSQPLGPGLNPLPFAVPGGAPLGNTFARFRFSSVGGLPYTGFWPDGEVEDYMVAITQPDLTIRKDDGGITTTPGSTVVYTLTYQNVGTQTVTGVTITDTVPANSTFNAGASTPGWTCVPNNNAGSVCTYNVGVVVAGTGGSVLFAVTVDNPLPSGVTQIVNTAWIQDDGSNGPDPTPGNNTSTDTTPVNAVPDMAIVKSDGGITSAPGGTVVYTLTYQNIGNQNATGVTITDTVPTNTTFSTSGSSVGWSCNNGDPAGTVCTYNVGNVAAGAPGAAVQFAVKVDSPLPGGVTAIYNTAWIQDDGTNGPDPNPSNNSSSDSTPVAAGVDMAIVKSDGGISTTPGGTVVYTLTYQNNGNQNATGVVITDTVPTNTTFSSSGSSVGWSCNNGDPAGTVCTISIGAVNAGAGGSVTFAVTVVNPLPAGVTQIVNTATIGDDGASGPDQNPADNTSTDTTPVNAAPDMTIVKSDGGISTTPGGTVVYTLTYQNVGNQDATGVTITDTVPANTTFNPGASTPGWGCVPNNNAGSLCNIVIGNVAGGGGGGAVLFAVTVVNPLPAGVTQIVNTAWVQDDGANGPDPTPSNNQSTDTTPVVAVPDLVITKDDGGISTTPGGIVTYTLTYQNVGNQNATGVTITDTVPTYTTFTPTLSSPGWACVPDNSAGSLCTFTIGALAGGGAGGVVTFTVVLDDPMDPRITRIDNTAWIQDDGSNGPDPTPSNNSDWDDTPVSPKTAVQLATFSGLWQAGSVRLEWSTLFEEDLVGFNVYRSLSFKYHGERVNAALIPAAGQAGQGGQYSLTDAYVIAGQAVYYWLEAVGAGTTQWFGPISPRREVKVFLPLSVGR